jgi:arginine decarboxylase
LKKSKRPKRPRTKNYKKFWKLGQKEFNTEYFDINKDGELTIREGNYMYNIYDLACKAGGAIEIYLPSILEARLSHLFKVANDNTKRLGYKGRFWYHFPMKVNQNKEIVLPLVSEGANLEVASANDLWIVKKLWEGENFYSRIRVLCNGPKTDQYIALIKKLRENGLSIIPIIEDPAEVPLFKGFNGDVGIRINLQSKVKSHWDKKIDRFGLLLDDILELGKIRNLKILHYHIGSEITVENDMIVPLREAFEAYKKIREINPTLDTINMGGGFAIPYEKKKMYSVESVIYRIMKTMKDMSAKAGIPHPNIIVEWGRYITAPSQINVYKIIGAKDIPKAVAKKWYIIDGSFMNDLLDTWAIHQKWHIVPVNNLDAKRRHRVWLAGLSCDSDDKYASSDGYLLLPVLEDLEEGESQYIAIFDTGAYQDAFSSHHCLLSSPAKLVLQNGIVTVARRRETPDDVGRLFGW